LGKKLCTEKPHASNNYIKEGEMDGTCDKGYEKYNQNFVWNSSKKSTHNSSVFRWENDIQVDIVIITVWVGFILCVIGINDGTLRRNDKLKVP